MRLDYKEAFHKFMEVIVQEIGTINPQAWKDVDLEKVSQFIEGCK